MAKLSARGRTEIVRIVKETEGDDLRDSSRKNGVIWQRATLVLMSDNVVLQKVDLRYTTKHEWERSYVPGTWRKRGKLKATENADSFLSVFLAPSKDGSPSGWAIAKDNRASAH